jgi:hypothetical protein
MAGLRRPGLLDVGPLEPDITSFRLHLAAEGKAARTVQGYTSAVRWFAAGYLLSQTGKTSWDQVDARDIQQWTAQLLAATALPSGGIMPDHACDRGAVRLDPGASRSQAYQP